MATCFQVPIVYLDRRVGLLEPDIPWYCGHFQDQVSLDQRGHAACALKMANVGLDCANVQWIVGTPLLPGDGLDCGRFDRIPS